MSASAAKQERALRRLRENIPLYSEECLRIKAKSGDIVPLKFNRLQIHLHEKLEEQLARTGKVRALIGKGRQGGVSTYIEARFYQKTSLFRGIETFILTHEQDATDHLFDMVHRFYDWCPLRPEIGAFSAKELEFVNLDSAYSIGTAGTKARGRSRTVQLFHGSEVAFWANASGHFAGIVQGVPDLPGTEVILESTGNGPTGEFHARWEQAERGIGDYIAIFMPWFWSDEYTRPVPEGFALDDEEREYASQHGLNHGQMAWRRAKVAELKDPLLFKQEYPATAAEMFLFTGRETFIKPQDVLKARKATCEGIGPLIIGVNPPRFEIDHFYVAWRRGRKVLKVESKPNIDAERGAAWLQQIIDDDNPDRVFIDVGGIGASVMDKLDTWGYPYDAIATPVNFGAEPQDDFDYLPDGTKSPGPANRRTEMWKRSRQWITAVGGADIPDEEVIQLHACEPGYDYDKHQRLEIEANKNLKSWDAIALTFAEPVKQRPTRPDYGKADEETASGMSWMGN